MEPFAQILANYGLVGLCFFIFVLAIKSDGKIYIDIKFHIHQRSLMFTLSLGSKEKDNKANKL